MCAWMPRRGLARVTKTPKVWGDCSSKTQPVRSDSRSAAWGGTISAQTSPMETLPIPVRMTRTFGMSPHFLSVFYPHTRAQIPAKGIWHRAHVRTEVAGDHCPARAAYDQSTTSHDVQEEAAQRKTVMPRGSCTHLPPGY